MLVTVASFIFVPARAAEVGGGESGQGEVNMSSSLETKYNSNRCLQKSPPLVLCFRVCSFDPRRNALSREPYRSDPRGGSVNRLSHPVPVLLFVRSLGHCQEEGLVQQHVRGRRRRLFRGAALQTYPYASDGCRPRSGIRRDNVGRGSRDRSAGRKLYKNCLRHVFVCDLY